VWLDERGVTHLGEGPGERPAGAREAAGAELAGLWEEGPLGPPLEGSGEGRTQRVIRGAAEDLARGETARAAAALESALRLEPRRPEAHWVLAQLDRQRGRFESSRAHLEAFLAAAGDALEPWRGQARRELAALDDELRLADPARTRAPGDFEGRTHPDFRLHYDPGLGQASPDYAARVLAILEEARGRVGERLGTLPAEPMGVVVYGKASYLEAHRHRFSFETVGFFDGRIHVVSRAHPQRELRNLLFHEYAHAVFRERTGGDRPFWLNEGLAELSEREGRSRDGLTRGERVALRGRLDEGGWIPLRQLAPSFAGLDDEGARAAYLESTAAAAWIEAHTTREARALLLARLGEGEAADDALREAVELDTDGVDAAVRSWLRDEFPEPAAPVQ
jgi:tetratricopeptide (TPR) repeat protein